MWPDLRRVAETASTNDDLKRLAAEGAPHGTALLADRQTSGRGRMGRIWEAGEGNVALSVLLRPNLPAARVPLACLAAAVAVAEALGAVYRIKWPNDVLAPDGRKVAGILAEAEPGRWLVIGVGVNVAVAPIEGASSVLEVEGEAPDRVALAERIAAGILREVARLEHDPAAVLERWRARSATLGRRVRVAGVEGEAVALDPDGALRVRTEDGERRIVAGDVEMVREG